MRHWRQNVAVYQDTAKRSCRYAEASLGWYNWSMHEPTPTDELRVVPLKNTDPIVALALRVLETRDRHEPVIE